MAEDYRQLQAPVQVDTSLPDSGASARAQALAQTFREFEGFASDVGSEISTKAGTIAGAAAGATGNPSYKTGLLQFTAYSRAYNNAATGQYAIEAEAHAEDTAARLRVEANNNPATFQATYSAVRDATLKNAPPMARAALTEIYNRHLAAGVAAISGDQAAELKTTQRQIYDFGVQRAVSRVAILQGSQNPQDQLSAMDEHAKLTALIQGGVNSGLYSPAEAQAMNVNAMRSITQQVFETQFDRALAEGGPGEHHGAVELLENFRKAHEANLSDTDQIPALSEPEFNQLMTNAKQKLTQQNLIEAYNKRDANAAQLAQWEAGDVKYTAMAADGTLTMREISSAIRTNDLKPETGRALMAGLQRGVDAPPDYKSLLFAEHNEDRFNWSTDQILAHAGGNAKLAITLSQKIEAERNGWEGKPAVKDARAHMNAELKIPSGQSFELLSDDEKKAAIKAQDDFTSQMNLIPMEKREGEAGRIAQNVIYLTQAREQDAAVASYQKGRAYAENTYGPNGSSPDPTKFQKAITLIDSQTKAAQEKAVQLRAGIK